MVKATDRSMVRVQDGDGSAANFQQHALVNAESVTPIGRVLLEHCLAVDLPDPAFEYTL